MRVILQDQCFALQMAPKGQDVLKLPFEAQEPVYASLYLPKLVIMVSCYNYNLKSLKFFK